MMATDRELRDAFERAVQAYQDQAVFEVVMDGKRLDFPAFCDWVSETYDETPVSDGLYSILVGLSGAGLPPDKATYGGAARHLRRLDARHTDPALYDRLVALRRQQDNRS